MCLPGVCDKGIAHAEHSCGGGFGDGGSGRVAAALPVTYDFVATGFTVTFGSNPGLMAAIGGGAVTGRITYDSAAGVDNGSVSDPEQVRAALRFPGSLSVTINGTTYESTPPNFVFSDDTDSNVDYIDSSSRVRIGDGLFVGPGGVAQSLFDAFNINVSAFGATTWDGVTPTVAQLNGATIRLASFVGDDYGVRATNVTFSAPVVAPVPLPAGGVLLASVFVGLALMSRRRA